jgi:hypothetical protein
MLRRCEACGSDFEQTGRGRPRRWCFDCSPRVADVGRAAVAAAWRAAHPDRVSAYNKSRRAPAFPRERMRV